MTKMAKIKNTINLNFGKMIYGFLIGAIIVSLLLLLVIYLFDYSRAFYLYSIFVIVVLIFNFSFGKKTANYLYGIDQKKSFTIEEQYRNDEKINTFQKTMGGLCFFSVLGLFIMSSANLFVLRNANEIPIFASISVFIFTLFMIISFLIVMFFYSKRII